jgi:UDP-glucose 4-epimerase
VRVLVTGATGYLGGAVLRRLQAAGHTPVALLRRPGVALPDGVEARPGDVLDAASLRAAVEGVDGVAHLAALTRVREAAGQADRYERVNVGGTTAALDAAVAEARRRDRPLRFLLASTAVVYGAATVRPIPETAPLAPLNPYATSKVAAERLVAGRAGPELAAAVLRVFNAAGAIGAHADTDPTRIVPRVLAVAAGRAPRLEVYGDGTAVRDYVHVADVGDAVVAALEAARPGAAPVWNVGASPASVLDLVEAARRVTGRPVPVADRPAVPGEAPDLRADTTAVRAALGWRPRRSSLEELLGSQWAAGGG